MVSFLSRIVGKRGILIIKGLLRNLEVYRYMGPEGLAPEVFAVVVLGSYVNVGT